MCDNCNKHYNVEPKDVSEEARQIVKMVKEFEIDRSNVGLKGFVDICKGKSMAGMKFVN